jgi:hypothetical protein
MFQQREAEVAEDVDDQHAKQRQAADDVDRQDALA